MSDSVAPSEAVSSAAGDPTSQGANGTVIVPETRERTARVQVVQQPAPGDSSDEEDEEGQEEELEDSEILADWPDDTEDIDLNHARLNSASVAKLGLPRFKEHLKRLCLRQNFISHLDPEIFGTLTKLEELDLYDNKIKHVDTTFNNLTNLVSLDLSYNLIKHVPEELEKHLTSLKTIFFIQNKISRIQNLSGFAANLRSLELGGNRIRTIEGLDALVNLEELWLGKNKISKLENLDNLKKLRILSIQSNRITKLEGLDNLDNLEELYLSHNGISRLEGLEKNGKLRTLDVGSNFVERLENIAHLTSLEELWVGFRSLISPPACSLTLDRILQMNDNKITTLEDVERQLKHIQTLETIYLERNPVQAAEGSAYRRKVILMLPQIQQLDATYVRQS
ncbi:L domain-like protein [Daedaleopsis nitida]|nr:L domain-like protein [Daedaleopsis nitida]